MQFFDYVFFEHERMYFVVEVDESRVRNALQNLDTDLQLRVVYHVELDKFGDFNDGWPGSYFLILDCHLQLQQLVRVPTMGLF